MPTWWNTTSGAVVAKSQFVLSDVTQTFVSLPPARLPDHISHSSATKHFEAILTHHHAQAHQWDRAAQSVAQQQALQVAVLGCSTTVGCGSADPSRLCDASRAWPRLFHDFTQSLLHELPGWNYGLQTRVHAKNAVDPTFFAQCTSSFVNKDTNVVLVEFFTNLFGLYRQGNHTGLDATIESIRESAPSAVVVFVVWLKEVTSGTAAHLRDLIATIAERQSADVLDVPLLMLRLADNERVQVNSWYANGGRDHHPNGAGHWLLASAAAQLVARRLARAKPSRAPPEMARAFQGSSLYCQDCAARSIIKRQMCYNTADKMPVRRPLQGSWELLDEGGDKGVAKLGYLSTRISDTIDFSLGVLCFGDGMGSASVRVGYHMSTRPGQGALHLRCLGCSCRGLHGILSGVNPFPMVQTDVQLVDPRYFSLPGDLNGSLSVTASTTFAVQPSSNSEACVVSVQHMRSKMPRSETSRVRIDALAFSTKCPHLRASGNASFRSSSSFHGDAAAAAGSRSFDVGATIREPDATASTDPLGLLF